MIIVTGASGGLAEKIIPELLRWSDVIGVYRSKKPTFTGAHVFHAEKVDLSVEAEIVELVSRWKARLQQITVVHMAAVKKDMLAAQLTTDEWNHMIQSNLTSDFLLTRSLLPIMVEQQWGRIIHISSTDGLRGQPGTVAYATTKAALTGLSNTLAHEYARFRITSNVLGLGYFDAGMFTRLTPAVRERAVQQVSGKRLGDPKNIANAIRFLVESDYVNGSTLQIDGGLL